MVKQNPNAIKISRAITQILPEYKLLEAEANTLTYQGVIDATYLKKIQAKITTKSANIKLTDISYKDGNSIIHFQTQKPAPKKSPSSSTIKNLKSTIKSLESDFQAELKNESAKDLKQKYLSKKGLVNDLTKQIPKLPQKSRGEAGKLINQLKKDIEKQIKNQRPTTDDRSTNQWLDVTAPGTNIPLGHMHPISQAIDEITRIFNSIGFTRVRYPEVDWDYYVFEALNMPPTHPARDEWETFFVQAPKHSKKGKMVLTTHTSNSHVREMERLRKPPIRMINIAKCYRRQADVTHTPVFHQFEGLVVDRDISIKHLKGTIDYFAHRFFGPKAKSRIRPFHFQFTEPSFEVDFSCTLCDGSGCKFCKSGWHEVGGAGMVHPNVLKAGGIDPEEYSGFAFGWGIERTYTLKPGLKIDDIRYFYNNNLDFLKQF